MGNGNAAKFKGFAEQCMAEYDLNGWTAPDLINPDDLSVHGAPKRRAQRSSSAARTRKSGERKKPAERKKAGKRK
jgi:hypothetical protein